MAGFAQCSGRICAINKRGKMDFVPSARGISAVTGRMCFGRTLSSQWVAGSWGRRGGHTERQGHASEGLDPKALPRPFTSSQCLHIVNLSKNKSTDWQRLSDLSVSGNPLIYTPSSVLY